MDGTRDLVADARKAIGQYAAPPNRADRRHPDRLLVPVPDACWLTGIKRSKMYELLAANEIESVKLGKSRLVVYEALVGFVEGLRQQQAS
jgi:excisionase family DNA binding protein